MFIVANWGMKGQESIIENSRSAPASRGSRRTRITGYGDMWIFKEALESGRLGRPKRRSREAIRKMNLKEGPAAHVSRRRAVRRKGPPGRRASCLIVQWQKGVPVTVAPADRALAKPYWPKR